MTVAVTGPLARPTRMAMVPRDGSLASTGVALAACREEEMRAGDWTGML
jgi:hypothetical protein